MDFIISLDFASVGASILTLDYDMHKVFISK